MTPADIDADVIEPDRLAPSAIDQITIERRRGDAGPRITSRDALSVLRYEAWLVAVSAENLAAGLTLTDTDRARLILASARVATIAKEAGA